MESSARPAQALKTDSSFRIRLVALSVLLIGLAFAQSPGLIVPDTKFDLVEAPGEFLSRALHLWNPDGTFGQLQNQAYGYLWPMGPFFALGSVLDLSGWVVQRLWLALVIVVAFVGAAKVARALGVRSDIACLAGGVAYALSPRMLTVLGPISIEAWPSALAPWVLLPLIVGATTGSPRRAAAWSALAITMVGGVNAAATFAVIPMAAIWLLTRTSGPRRRSLMLWWVAFTALGTLWWLVPLFVLGGYSPPFLDYIETSAATTFPTTVFDVLRGTSNWVPYLEPDSRAGHDLITLPYLVLNSGVLLVLGFAGLIARWSPHRRFLVLSLVVGVLMVAAGHHGAVEGWFAADVRSLLDGALAPLRNVHKFDPVVRLPLVIGFAIALDRLVASAEAHRQRSRPVGAAQRVTTGVTSYAAVGMALIALAGSVAPVVNARVTPNGGMADVAEHWREASAWLDDHAEEGSALLVPGASFGEYVWGSPKDEPLQYLTDAPWAVRDAIPLTPAGTIRFLDAVEERIAQGDGSSGVAEYLGRAGVAHVVVRHDLERSDDVPDPVLVRQALVSSGLQRVAQFGPENEAEAVIRTEDGRRIVANGGWQSSLPAVEIFAVPSPSGPAVSTEQPVTVAGGPEDVVDLLDLGLLDDTPSVLASDRAAAGDPTALDGPVILTDGLRERERNFGRIHDGSSAVLMPGDRRRTGSPATDYEVAGERWKTTARLDGVSEISASSSRSDATAPGGVRRSMLPFSAFDGRRATQWASRLGAEGRAWWQVELDTPTDALSIQLVGGADAPKGQRLRVRTANGVTEPIALDTGERRRVMLPAGAAVGWIRVEAADGPDNLALSKVLIDDGTTQARRRLETPRLPEEWGNPDAIVLRADHDARRGCADVDGDVRCVAGRAYEGEEPLRMDRAVALADDAEWIPELRVRMRDKWGVPRLLQGDREAVATASSQAAPDPRASALSAVDGNIGTSWVSAPDDVQPALKLRWNEKRPIRRIQIVLDEAVAAQRPVTVRLTSPEGEQRRVELDDDGVGRFSAIRTDRLKVQVVEGDGAQSLGFDVSRIPIGYGITEVRLGPGKLFPQAPSEIETDYGCGSGPQVRIDGTTYRTSVTGTPAAMARGESASAYLCAPDGEPVTTVDTSAGGNLIDIAPSRLFAAEDLVLRDPASDVGPITTGGADSASLEKGPSERVIDPSSDAGVVALRQNANPGWTAELDGEHAPPITVDGWQQGWIVPETANDDDDVQMVARFGPDQVYRTGLFVGLGTALLLLVAVIAMRWRWRGPEPPPLATRPMGPVSMGALTLVLGGLVAGWVGAGLAAVVLTATMLGRRRLPTWTPWLVAASCLIAAGAYAVRPWDGVNGWAGETAWVAYLALVPVLVAMAASASRAAPGRIQRGMRSFIASEGRSIKR